MPKGWMVGKNKMTDWKASVGTWERKSSKKQKQDYAQRTYSAEHFEKDREESDEQLTKWYNEQKKDDNGNVITEV